MNYFRTDTFTYAREVANQIGGTLYFAGSIEDLELPDPNNFTDGSVIIHFNNVYIKTHNGWVELYDNHNTIYDLDYEAKYEVEEETDTAPWLALLEE